MNWTGKRVRRSRAVRGIVAAAVAGVCVIGVAGCSSTVSGTAVSTGTGASAGATIQAAGIDGVTCATPSTAFDTYCETSAPTARDIPSGSTLRLRAGDPITLAASGGKARTCAVGAFAKDSSGAIYAVAGPSCATSTGTATTTDGYKIGEFRTIIVRTQVTRRVPVVKLAEGVRWEQSAKTIAAAAPNAAVKVTTPHGGLEWSNANEQTLNWRGAGTAPKMRPGDAGSPVMQGETLVGLGDQYQGLLDSAQLGTVLAGIGSGASLAV